MIHTLLTRIRKLGDDEPKYIVHSYDETDIVSLIPTSKVDLLTELDLKTIFKKEPNKCSNFSVTPEGVLVTPPKLPEKLSTESQEILPHVITDDVWHLLHKLRNIDALFLISIGNRSCGDFSDEEKTYLVNTRTATYSTTHANFSVPLLIDGTVYNPDTDDVYSSKRWTTHKIVKDNKLVSRYLTVITTQQGLDVLRNGSIVDISVVSVTKALHLEQLSMVESEDELLYCIIDLYSLPIVRSNSILVSNFSMMFNFTQTLNHITMLNKVVTSFVQEIAQRDSAVLNLMESDEFYKHKAIKDEDVRKTPGVKFTLSGQSNVPSVNACLKALKMDNVKKVADVLDMSMDELANLKKEFYRLNVLQSTALNTLVHLCEEYHTVKNPIICYEASDQLCKFYTQQRELYKARLTYVRSIYMNNLQPEVFTHNKEFTSTVNGTTIFIDFGEY